MHKLTRSPSPKVRLENAQFAGLLWRVEFLVQIGTFNFGSVCDLGQALAHGGLV